MDLLTLQEEEATFLAELALVEHLLQDPRLHTPMGLQILMRSLFRQLDQIEAQQKDLPDFEEEELDLFSESERLQYELQKTLQDELMPIVWKIDLLAQFLGVSKQRIFEVWHIIGSHYMDE